jgi:hypothetical protein
VADLTPAAQAVLDAIVFLPLSDRSATMEGAAAAAAAAALRAAADQVVPAVLLDRRYITEERWDARDDIRFELLSIAAELENHQ